MDNIQVHENKSELETSDNESVPTDQSGLVIKKELTSIVKDNRHETQRVAMTITEAALKQCSAVRLQKR